MNKCFSFTHVRVLFLVIVTLGICTETAFAQTPLSGTFTVSPAKVEVVLAPGEEKVIEVRLTNGTIAPLHIDTSFEDVASKSQRTPTEDPIRLLGDTLATNTLKALLSVSRSSFDLLSAKSVIVPVTVRVPKGALPGGRYGSVVFNFQPALLSGAKENANIAVSSRVVVLIYVRISGEVKEEGKLAAFGVFNESTFIPTPTKEKPLRFQVAFENTGDVYLNPHGTVTLTSLFGNKVYALVDPFAVLPGAIRMREIDVFEHVGVGYYTAELSLARGYGDAIDTERVHFSVLPTLPETLIVLVLLIALFFLIRRSLNISRSAL